MSPLIVEGENRAIFSYALGEGIRGEADLLGNNNGKAAR